MGVLSARTGVPHPWAAARYWAMACMEQGCESGTRPSHKWSIAHVCECPPLAQMELCAQAHGPASHTEPFPLPSPPPVYKAGEGWGPLPQNASVSQMLGPRATEMLDLAKRFSPPPPKAYKMPSTFVALAFF